MIAGLKGLLHKLHLTGRSAEPRKPIECDELPFTHHIAICNQKGGCGKTTTAINLGAGLAMKGRRTLLIDLDPQCHATLGLGFELSALKRTVYDLFRGQHRLEEVVVPTQIEGLFLAPASSLLSGSALELCTVLDRETILRDALRELPVWYEYILIDCSPSLSLLTLNALVSADHVLVPLQPHYFALEGMRELFQTLDLVRERFNPNLKLLGILPTMVDRRHRVNRDLFSQIREYFADQVLSTHVRFSPRLVEASIAGQPVMIFDFDSRGSKDYRQLTNEVLRRLHRPGDVIIEMSKNGAPTG